MTPITFLIEGEQNLFMLFTNEDKANAEENVVFDIDKT